MFARAGPVKVAGGFGATLPIFGGLSHPAYLGWPCSSRKAAWWGQDDVQQAVVPQQLEGALRCAIRHQLLHLQLHPALSHPASTNHQVWSQQVCKVDLLSNLVACHVQARQMCCPPIQRWYIYHLPYKGGTFTICHWRCVCCMCIQKHIWVMDVQATDIVGFTEEQQRRTHGGLYLRLDACVSLLHCSATACLPATSVPFLTSFSLLFLSLFQLYCVCLFHP